MDGVLRRARGGPLSLATRLSLSGTCRHSTLYHFEHLPIWLQVGTLSLGVYSTLHSTSLV